MAKSKTLSRTDNIPGYIYALDGLRALSLILIFIFHDWQQSWIYYRLEIAQGKYLFDFTLWQRYGYIAVDSFYVLSGFCLFYPVVRTIFGESNKKIDLKYWKNFYIKRARKIWPVYLFVLILCALFPKFSYVSMYDPHNFGEVMRQFLTHALFIHNFFDNTVGPFLTVSWTLAIEVQFYLVFPIFAMLFKKKPYLTFAAMAVLAHALRFYGMASEQLTQVVYDRMPYYLDIFAWGMLGAYLVVKLRNSKIDRDKLKPFMFILSILSLVIVWQFTKWMSSVSLPNKLGSVDYFRMYYRTILAFAFAAFIFTTCFSFEFWERRVWGNKLFVFLSTISYSFYLFHQQIHILLKSLKIPYTTMEKVQNDRAAMDGFVLLTIVLSIGLSVLTTYLIEIPFAKYGFKGYFVHIYEMCKAGFYKLGKKQPVPAEPNAEELPLISEDE